MEATNVLIVASRQLVREVLARILARMPEIGVVEFANDRAEAQRAVDRRRIDIALLAFAPSELHELGLIRGVKALQPRMKILVLSGHSELKDVARALVAGADGILTRDSILGELAGAIRHVSEGGRYVCPDIAHAFAMRGIRSDSGRLPARHSPGLALKA